MKVSFYLGTILALVSATELTTVAAEPIVDGPIVIGSRLEPLFDSYLIDQLQEARLMLHRPTPREISIVHDEPWEGNTSGYHTVFADGDLYRMYYRGHAMDASGKLKMAHSEVTCYAVSRDGIVWTKPTLNLFAWAGSKANNIILLGEGTHNFSPFIDTRPNCPTDERYKAIGGTSITGLLAFKSGDGIRWSKMQDKPVVTEGAFDSLNVAFWDAHRQHYRLYIRIVPKGRGLRLISVATSKDFLTWTPQEELEYPGSPDQQMYTNQIQPYFRAPHLLMGFPTRYVARPLTEHVKRLDPVGLRTRMTKSYQRVGSDLTDGLFMTSRDGLNFHRWDEAFLRPGPQGEGRWMYGDNYQTLGLIETRPSIAGGPREISLFATEQYWRDDARLRRYTIRLDGFVSVYARFSGGEVLTKPLIFAGQSLVINYSTSAAGSVRVELQDADGKPQVGFRLEDCPEHYGDSVSQTIHWTRGVDVSTLAGKPIRIRFVLRDADLFSFRFLKS